MRIIRLRILRFFSKKCLLLEEALKTNIKQTTMPKCLPTLWSIFLAIFMLSSQGFTWLPLNNCSESIDTKNEFMAIEGIPSIYGSSQNMALMDYDLALRKTVEGGPNFEPSDNIIFTITVFNQGNLAVQNVIVSDFIPNGFTLMNGWIPNGNFVSNIIPGTIEPGDSASTEIILEILPGTEGTFINIAEILSFEDLGGNDVTDLDFDSIADEDPTNDFGINDEINDDGTFDEDDHDIEIISVCSTPEITDILSTNPTVCGICDGTITISTNDQNVEYTIDGGQTWSANAEFSGLCPGEYSIGIRNDDESCPNITESATLEGGTSVPIIESINSTDPSDCDSNDGSIEVIASGSDPLEFSIDGGSTWQGFNTFSNLGAGVYSVIVRILGSSCESEPQTIMLNTPDAPEILQIITEDPASCDIENGTIVISATGGIGGFEYSIDGGVTWQVLNTFQGLSSGTYPISVRNDDGTCQISGGNAVLVGDPEEPMITDVFTSDPTDCGFTDGIITIILGNDMGDFEYSIDGGQTWIMDNSFPGLAGGIYEVMVRKLDGTCAVSGSTFELTEPPTPIIDEITSIDPANCNTDDGTIVINATPGPGFLQYSIDGGNTWEIFNTFTGLSGGNYQIAVRNTNGSCVTFGSEIILVTPQIPSINSVFPSDPSDCVSENGGIIVSATPCGDSTLEYSIDGGQTWQESDAFPNLGAGTYEILIRNVGETETVSTGSIELVAPPPPTIDEVVTVGPDCEGNLGSITINASGGDDFEYSIDGGITWQASNVFTGLMDGTFAPAVRFSNTTCLTIGDAVFLFLDDVVDVEDIQIVDPGCDAATGSITIIVTSGADLEFSLDDGQTWQASNFFGGLEPGIYLPAVRTAGGGCETFLNQIELVESQAPEIQSVTFTNVSACGLNDGSISIAATGSTDLEYSIDGGSTWELSGDFNNLTPGIYTIFVRNNDGTCPVEYSLNPVTITEPEEGPVIDQIQITEPSICGANDASLLILASGNPVIQYSIDGGENFQFENNFSGLSIGVYEVVLQFPGSTCQTTTSVEIGNGTACIDLIEVNIPFETTTEICLDETVLQIVGTLTSADFCDQGDLNTVFGIIINNNCLTLDPADGFVGVSPDTICTIHCYDNDPNLCDTTQIIVTVDPQMIDCDDVFVENEIEVDLTNIPTQVCVPLSILDAINLNLFLNGEVYNDQLSGCDADSVVVYSYAPLPGQGFDGPYTLVNWMASGSDFSGTFTDALDLVDQMNSFDPDGNWNIDTTLFLLISTNSDGGYGDMDIIQDSSNNESTLQANLTTLVNGTNINISQEGENIFVVENPEDGCTDTLIINATNTNLPIDTLVLNIPQDNPIDTCLTDLIQLEGDLVDSGICEINEEEVAITITDDCVTIDPVDGFVGFTEVCVFHCDEDGICDTTIIQINIELVCPDLFLVESLEISSNEDTVAVCIPADINAFGGFSLTLDGEAYNEALVSCSENGQDGILVDLVGAGPHVLLALDTLTGCQDQVEIQINTIPDMSDIDTIFVSIPQGTTDEIICGNALDLPGNAFNVGFCQIPSNGVAPVVNDSCVSYTPGAGFIGVEEFCMIICDDLIPSTCDSFLVFVSVTPPIDTLELNDPGLELVDTCLNSNILQLPGTISSTEICGIEENNFESFGVDNDCLSFDLIDDFSGSTEICVIHCDDSFPSICDTSIIIINQEGILCPEIFPADPIELFVDSTGTVDYCIDIPASQILNYNLSLDGVTYDGPFDACNVDSAFIYFYGLVPGALNEGPYAIDWLVGGQNELDTINAATELLDFMNTVDPTGMWELNEDATVLVSMNDQGDYGVLMVSQLATMAMNDLQPNFNGIPFGTQITISGEGTHIFIAEDQDTGCTDTLLINIDATPIIEITTFQNTPSETVCLDTMELMGNFDTLVVCEEPSNGIILIDGNCFTYLPINNFIGMDTACVAVCDDQMNCDTSILIATIESLCNDFGFLQNQTMVMEIEDCNESAEICLPITFDSLLMNYNILDNGFPYSAGFAGCDFDTCIVYSAFSIPDLGLEGPYQLDSWFVDGNGFSGEFEDVNALIDSLNTWDPSVDWFLEEGTNNIKACGITSIYSDFELTQINTGTMAVVDAVPDFFPNGVQIQLDTGFHEVVFIDIESGCTDTLFTEISCQPVDSTSCGINALTDTFIFLENCDDSGEFCVDIPIFFIEDFVVTSNGAPYDGTFSPCSEDPQSIAMFLTMGEYEIVFEDTVKMCVDTFNITVSCEPFEDIVIDTTLSVGQGIDICLEDLGFPLASIDSIQNTCIDMSTGNALFELDEDSGCITIIGELEGLDTACFKLFLFDTCATVFINAEITQPCAANLFDEINIGQGVTDCTLGEGFVCLPIRPIDFQNYTIDVNGVAYSDPIVPCDFDTTFTYDYSTLPSGGLLGPYILISWTVNGQTFDGAFNDAQELVDSLNLWDPGCNWEVQTVGDNTSVVGGCSENDYSCMVVEQEINPGAQTELCVNTNFIPMGSGITLPIGTFELIFTDTSTNCIDTLIATLDCITTDTIPVEVGIDSSMVVCVDTTDLPGNIVDLSLGCLENFGEFSNVTLLGDTCVTVTGIELGSESACLILCDDLGVCDTTVLLINVTSEESEPPIAEDDIVNSGQGLPISFDVTTNDSMLITITDIFILDPPEFGDVEFIGDGFFQYVPDPGYCNSSVPDTFTYVVCNTVGCDTATVFVTIECTEFIIFNGFSPNSDAVNDEFVIQGISQYPDHLVQIFNRWGNLVYETRDYHLNRWQGRWEDKDVPDGTYFYVIDLGDGEVLKGYVQLHR